MSATNEVMLESASLERGETERITCPACGGGRTSELSLNVTVSEDGQVLWNCFRASCGFSGSGYSGGRKSLPSTAGTQGRRKRSAPFTGNLRHLTLEEERELRDKVGFTDWHLRKSGVMVAPDKGRYAFPIYGPMGRRRGWVLRTWADTRSPKALTRMDSSDEPITSWYVLSQGDPVLLVEDIPSAVRASCYMNAVALVGTGLSKDAALELASVTRSVVVALDNDATREAVKLRNRISLLFDSSAVLPLAKDLKDMDEDDLKALLEPLASTR